MSVADKIELINTKLSECKTMLSDNITAKGVMASASESLQSLAAKIATIEQGGGEEALHEFGVRLTYPDRTTQTDVYSDGVVPSSGYSGNTNIIFAEIGDGLTTVGKGAFAACTRLTDVKIGSRVTKIDNSVFNGCKSLIRVVIPDNVKNIGTSAFYGCSEMESLSIGSGVTSVGSYSFSSCSSLGEIICKASVAPTLGTTPFGVASEGTLYIPRSSNYSTWSSKLPSVWTITETDF